MAIMEADSISPEADEKQVDLFVRMLEKVSSTLDITVFSFDAMLDGILIVPVLLRLNKHLQSNGKYFDSGLFHQRIQAPLINIFLQREWIIKEGNTFIFTDTGAALVAKSIYVETLVFPNFLLTAAYQLQEEAEDKIVQLFDHQHIDRQPKYIAEMGCGEGINLKRIYEKIVSGTRRGKHLESHPLTLIGIDQDKRTLDLARENLADYPMLLIQGDLSAPGKIAKILTEKGIAADDILYTGLLPDFTGRPSTTIISEDKYISGSEEHITSQTPFISIVPTDRYWKNWAALTGKHGLVLLTGYCLEPECFDVLDVLHVANRPGAASCMLEAANVGLFANRPLVKYPDSLSFTRLSFGHYQQRNYQVRYASRNDLPVLMQLETVCWAADIRLPKKEIVRRLKTYPEGQFVIEENGNVLGVIYTQRITDETALYTTSVDTVGALHHPDGAIVQLLSINIFPECQSRGLGDELLEFIHQYVALMNDVTKVCAITRSRDFKGNTQDDYAAYIRQTDEHGYYADPIIRFHQVHGAQLGGIVSGYRAMDKENLSNGILVHYDVRKRQRFTGNGRQAVEKSGLSLQEISAAIQQHIAGVLPEAAHIDMEQPLMEMGLDSGDLMGLGLFLDNNYNIAVPGSFFFEYNTIGQVAEKVVDMLAITSAVVADEEDVPNHREPQEKFAETISAPGDIAIVGTAFRVPGASTKEALWNILIEGRSAITTFPEGRWTWPEWVNLNTTHKGIDRGGYLPDIDKFDASFFRISPREAELMDPQQRLLLELTWELLEDAGYKASTQKGSKTGVYIGASGSDYELLLGTQKGDETLTGTGTSLAILANRLSYFYDFEGPSMLIDTACSSSLVAINEAITAISTGKCSQAIVGAVHLMCHPSRSLAYHQSHMLSEDGRCQTFDAAANGYVRAEGGIMLFLKPLAQAIADNDDIRGVIKGTAVNHGGQSGGLTVPNPEKQRRLLEDAYTNAKVDIRTVSYLEAHGTGTSLGDPIEIAGLTAAFKSLQQASGEQLVSWCGIGSVKTNIGHLEAASGMAGILKVLLSMEHRLLPPTCNYKKLNPKIILTDSPFYIQQKLQSWQPTVANAPLRAGVSSFGIGGANGHVVLESYPQAQRIAPGKTGPCLFVLSAKNIARLKHYAENILRYLDENVPALSELCYTLQMAREEMEERLAIVCRDIEELVNILRDYASGLSSQKIYTGNIKTVARSTETFDIASMVARRQITTEALQDIATYWCTGGSIDWTLFYEKHQPGKIRLPTYPFAKDRYWLPDDSSTAAILNSNSKLHPLLHHNSSTLKEQQFTSSFNGKEFFLADHKVRDEKVFPGVAYLELAREAGEQSLQEKITQLKDVRWLSPIQVGEQPVEVFISLFREKDDTVYEVYTHHQEGRKINSQGKLSTKNKQAPENFDLAAIRQKLLHTREKEACYQLFKAKGLKYGSSFQGIEMLYYGETASLSKVTLPEEKNYVLSPGVLDSALQTCLGLHFAEEGQTLALPFSVGEVNIYHEIPATVWCYARPHQHRKSTSTVTSYDIDILGDAGQVLLSFIGVVMLPLDGFYKPQQPAEKESTHLYHISWQPSLPAVIPQQITTPTPLVLLAGGSADLADKLKEVLEQEVILLSGETTEAYFLSVLEKVKQVLTTKTATHIMIVCSHADYLDYGFVSGLLKTATLENPRVTGKVIGVERLNIKELDTLITILEAELHTADTEVCYHEGTRTVKMQQAITAAAGIKDHAGIKEGGVYLIVGGAGGLGQIFAAHISQTPGTQVILTGRKALSVEQQTALSALPNVVYYPCDITNRAAVNDLIESIKTRYRKLDGVIHSAGVIRDSFLVNKTGEEAAAVLLPKITGAKNIDEATKEEALDFMVFFSSVSGVLGNVGQADYASANAWLDNYAHYRNTLQAAGKRYGKTLSINWPLWKEGGMQITAESEKYLAKQWGMLPLPTTEGIHAFETLLNHVSGQGMVAYRKADISAIDRTTVVSAEIVQPSFTHSDDKELQAASIRYLRGLLARELKLPEDKFDLNAAFAEYGIDSILITRLTNCLEEVFDRLPMTLFFEYQDFGELIGYFIREHSDVLRKLTGHLLSAPNTPVPVVAVHDNTVSASDDKYRQRFTDSRLQAKMPVTAEGDVAIIGLSGRYPGARNINEFWENLKAGKDSITVVPKDRWDASSFYSEEKGKEGSIYSKWGGFIDDIDQFDPLFFSISPKEAERMDPQERLFLQTVWETIEDAGYTREMLQGTVNKDGLGNRVGVYAGVMYEEYQLFGAEETLRGNPMGLWGNTANIANRVSYFFNFHGPSMAVDTMCSSSLTAIHLACRDILTGETDLAIAGGVNVSVHPSKYLMLSHGGFVSGKGKCESFGEGGDGYVPGEGVGAVLLKPFSKALADGDHIYGVIKGSAVNHGGKVSGYTVPNPKMQSALIKEAIRKAGVNAADFSYIEAHGTGTSLGDPIEIAGLTHAFESRSKQYCSIGSVKSNIGHCESAAGISGLTKVLLQLKHQQLVPSLHSAVLNPYINFADTPFRVQQQLEKWTTTDNQPRLAGISSFGAGGSNAHLIVAEYQPTAKKIYTGNVPVIVVLSSRNETQLKEQASGLQHYITMHPDANLHDIAYTLQIGREAMDERLALTVDSIITLSDKLTDYLAGRKTDLFTGNSRKDKVDFLLNGGAGNAYITYAIANREMASVAQLWVRGVNIDWTLFYGEHTPARISLPTYPFAKERYWIPLSEGQTIINGSTRLHPLLHSNSSSLKEQQFTSIYTGKESFLTDHKVREEKILPAAALLELAREAGAQSTKEKITQLKDISWLSPIQVNDTPQKVYINLYPADEEIIYEVYTENAAATKLHSEGRLSTIPLQTPGNIDLEAIRKQLLYVKEQDECYQLFNARGLNYGAGFRGIQKLYYSTDEALSRIVLPRQEDYILNPGMLDSALQTCAGISFAKEEQSLALPFSVGEVNIYRELPAALWCYVKERKRNNINSGIASYDIVLLGEEGEVLLSLTELVLLPADWAGNTGQPAEKAATFLHDITWELSPAVAGKSIAPAQLILLAGGSAELADKLKERLAQEVVAMPENTPVDYFINVLEIVKEKLAKKTATHIMVVCSHADYLDYGFVSGLLKTAAQENPKVTGKVIGVDSLGTQDLEMLTGILEAEQYTTDTEVRYQAGKRSVRTLHTISATEGIADNLIIKEGGVYLITGGAGGLGQIFAGYISQTANTQLILTGRGVLTTEKQTALSAFPNAAYYQCDVSNAEDVTALITTIKTRYTRLDGIIHSAGVIRDSFILNKTREEAMAVLLPKIAGAKNLDEATKGETLDFMVFFSSIAGVLGNVGQADYAAANAWLDNYAHYRHEEQLKGKRKGRTLSINWPLWKEGGMQIDEASEAYLEKEWGMLPLPTAAGIQAFETLLKNGSDQGVVIFGRRPLSTATLTPEVAAENILQPSVIHHKAGSEKSAEVATSYLRSLLSKELKLPEEKLESDLPLGQYGIDSVLITRLNGQLEETFGRLPKTLFFEYQTLGELAEYFITSHGEKLLALAGAVSPSVVADTTVQRPVAKTDNRNKQRFAAAKTLVNPIVPTTDIAIIGVSGRYPGAKNIHEFWENLKAGKDSITEIPEDRWEISDFYSEEKGKEGRSYSKWGGFIEGIDRFDPLFFNISPREAELMDPQERLFLQTVWETIEDAGYTREMLQGPGSSKIELAGKVGVYAGVMYDEYQLFGVEESLKGNPMALWGTTATIANRVSSFFNFHGPSMAVDTMCSSSLTAIHLACESIQNGNCDLAVAGGVNVSVHPNKYLMLSQGRFLSGKGRCESFGEGGEGYVPGEGVGAVLLKPLSKAVADGDHIYGVIKGTAVNHGGKTNGYTVPNPNAQSAVIREAIRKAGIKATDFSYIEAHGTGTSLGDPIEITGLTKAFEADSRQYCSIGSVKSNIGHCESAAGISGITKVLLQLKHQQLVPSLHAATLNPNIDFTVTPFRVQQVLEVWTTTENRPRLAGVSSFGAGGSNAHIIIQEYTAQPKIVYTSPEPAIIILSAMDTVRVKEQVVNLKHFLAAHPDANLYDIAYTLQIGREAMEERLALVVNDKEALLEKLNNYLAGKTSDIFTGNIKKDKSVFSLEGNAGKAYIESALKDKESRSIAQLWVKGSNIDWTLLYDGYQPDKISLPTYPFAAERYWIPGRGKQDIINNSSKLHPLLHRNSSNLKAQQFTSIYTGKELFLTDHKVREEKVLPGVAYLEMAREAGVQSIEEKITQLKDVSWLSPIQVNGTPEKVQIRLYPEGTAVAYEIYRQTAAGTQIHSQGKLSTQPQQAPEKVDLNAIRQRLPYVRKPEECYHLFKARGLHYGTSFQGIEELRYSETEALSKIVLQEQNDFVLNPGMLDSALQTCAGLSFVKEDQSLMLPFSVEEVNIYQELPAGIWCYARNSKHHKAGNKVSTYDIDLLNEAGEVLLRFSALAMLPPDGLKTDTGADKVSTHLYNSTWQPSALTSQPQQGATVAPMILLAGGTTVLADKLKEELALEVGILPEHTTVSYFMHMLQVVKAKLLAKQPAHIIVVCSHADYPDYGFVSGLFKTATQENPAVTGKIVSVDQLDIQALETLTNILKAEQHTIDAEVRYYEGKRAIKITQAIIAPDTKEHLPVKEGGVYLITGGAGGLGLIFARYISQTPDTHLILTGRSALTKEKEETLAAIPNVMYIQCDVSNAAEVTNLIATIKTRYAKLDGIIHSAGVIRDSFIINKTEEEARAVLLPKIAGAKYLDEATMHDPIDFMVFFSSVAGVLGNVGQADYASANAWLDNYAHYRREEQIKGKRYGKTLSINWPLWSAGGMQITAESEAYLEQQWGMLPLPTDAGIGAFETLLAGESEQGIVVYGKDSAMGNLFNPAGTEERDTSPLFILSENGKDVLRKASVNYIRKLLARDLKLPEDKFEPDTPFGKYGVDSVLIIRLTNSLEEVFGRLPKTLFFEYPTFGELATYFIEKHSHKLRELTNHPEQVNMPGLPESSPVQQHQQRFVTAPTASAVLPVAEDIAIIGLGGRYPGANNIHEFWENLKAGKDCITEIPGDRWNIDNFYHKEKGKEGRSYSKWGGFIDGIDQFDPLFFNISPREAELMDPQERLFLQTVWETIEDAGYTREMLQGTRGSKSGLGGRVGVYAGVMYEEYQLFGAEQTMKGNPMALWGSPASIANRISYFFNLHGPCMTVDTMCSSSLTAIHLACKDIQTGETDLAIAGGVNVSVHPNKYLLLSQTGFVSDKGKCESFGEGGDGYVPGEGVGAVLLKSLSKAIADGDRIYGVIKGTAINHGGSTGGYTVPNPKAQAAVIKDAIGKAGVKAADFSYIEAHGTGTSLGDPIEIAGLTQAFEAEDKQYCSIGSVKSNIGHCESAAGISGLTKVLLQLKHQQLVPSLHAARLNPYINFADTPFKVQRELAAWTTVDNRPRLAGISSFGAGGSNAHIIIEEYRSPKAAYTDALPVVILLSAQDTDRLKEQARNLKDYITTHPGTNLHDIAYTLQTGREAMEERLAFIAGDIEILLDKLTSYLSGKNKDILTGNIRKDKHGQLLDESDNKTYIEKMIKDKVIEPLAQLWINGERIEWALLYEEGKPEKISLPTYPFAKERCWAPPADERQIMQSERHTLHPLLHFQEEEILHPLLHKYE
ncbi:SDR family NAD(P)-dependent oxidoreductase [Chitinophaga flava]|nr:SDR family NAD(P)-dependent oxidoreductase [Chitinophaga flava]